MKLTNKGSVMIWVIIVLFTLSVLLAGYAKVVFNDYNISLSIFRQHRALQNSYAGLAVAKDYFKSNQSELLNNFYLINNNESLELYPADLSNYSSILNDFNISSIYLHKTADGELYIYSKAFYSKAVVETRIKITDVHNNEFGTIEQIK